MADVVKNVGTVRITVAWKEELVGDEADTDRFYLRLQPTFTKRISMHNTRPIAECVARRVQQELKRK